MRRREAMKAAALTAASYAKVLGANDRVGLGVIGVGGRGTYVMSQFQKQAGVEVRAVCDVYAQKVDAAQQKAPGAQGFSDHRKLLETKGIDAVLIGTPDHWHRDTAIDAMEAGKDVYVEKPLVSRREDGPDIVKTARVTGRICQVGMQQRSGPIYLEAKEKYVKSGALGKITHIRCVWNSGPARRLPTEPVQQPSNLDWVRYLGRVKYRDWNPGMYRNFRAFLDFGGGKMTDFGAHWIDVVHMFMERDDPMSVSFAGGILFDFKDGRTAPDTVNALYEYPGFTVQFESNAINGPEYGCEFYGTNGSLFINRNRYEFKPAEKGALKVEQKIPGDITLEHVQNFLECIKTRKLPNGDVYLAHRSCQACLLAIQSYQERRKIWFDAAREEVMPL